MPLESVVDMLQHARRHGYALGYFESWNLESVQGVLDAAEQTRAPIIIGFNGDFMSRPERLAEERLAWYAQLGRAAAESAKVPCGLIFNECPHDDWTRRAVSLGFNLVVISDCEAATSDHYIERVASLTSFAHEHATAVEIEINELPCGVPGFASGEDSVTDPEFAARIVEATGIDLLAVSVGNVHIMLEGSAKLDMDRLAAIAGAVPVPLVLHGGSGIPEAELRRAISLGVAKVNYGTYLKQRYLAAIRQRLDSSCNDPHRMLGCGGPEDLLVAGRLAVRDAVLERIESLGCCGKA
jgi:ketose-bisphosphate aldolase